MDKEIKRFILPIVLCLTALTARSQSDGNYEYTKEVVWGVNKNTNGGLIGGFIGRISTALNKKKFRVIGIEVVNVKDPNEYRRISGDRNRFIYGKVNYLYAIRLQYGWEYLLFKKAPQKGVQINALFAGGLSLGVITPYYVRGTDGKSRPYTPTNFPDYRSISGTGGVFEGLGKASIRPGVNVKASLCFEMGIFKSNVTGFELGLSAEAYTEKIVLIATKPAKSFFFAPFATWYFGWRK